MYTEVLKAVEGIESKVIGKLGELDAKNRELSDEIFQLKQRGVHMPQPDDRGCFTLGEKVFKEITANGDLLSKSGRLRLAVKAAGDVTTTSTTRTITSIGLGGPAGMPIGVQRALRTRTIGQTTAVEYSRYLAQEGAAAVQTSEGTAKAAVRPTFTLITQNALTIAGYSKVSKQALSDQAELVQAVDVTLRRSLNVALDALLVAGSWGGAAGLLAHATAFTSTAYNNLWDAASEGVATMQTAGFMPDTVVLSPGDWLAVTTAKASGSGEYLSGAYLAPLAESLRGMRVALSPSVTTGKVMVLDSSQVELLLVEDIGIEIGTENDDFTKNVRTILGEMRVIPVFRSVGAARLITPAP